MSAVQDYRKECASRGLWPVPEDGSLLCIADAAIAELGWAITQWHAEEDDWVRDRAALKAELAALEAERDQYKNTAIEAVMAEGEATKRAEKAEAILLGEDVTVAAYKNMQVKLEKTKVAAGVRYEENVILKHNLEKAEAELSKVYAALKGSGLMCRDCGAIGMHICPGPDEGAQL